MILGAQLYTVRDLAKTPEQFLDTMQKIKAMSYQAAQPSAIWQLPIDAIANAFHQTGLLPVASHVSFDELEKDAAPIIENHRKIGCGIVGIGSMPEHFKESPATFADFARRMSKIAAVLKSEGLGLLYHNHAFEFQRFDGKSGMDILFEEFSPDVQFELDLYWVQAGGANPIDWIEKVAGRMKVVHFKDMVGTYENTSRYTHIGGGNLNWPGILEACRRTGVECAMVELDVCPGDPLESLQKSIAYLRSIGA